MIIEEITAWSVDEARIHVHRSLPEGWTFRHDTDPEDRRTSAVIHDADGVEQWSSEEPLPDLRMVFLEAYGWLHTRNHSIRHPAWNRRSATTAHGAIEARFGIRVATPDPDDLDPKVLDEEMRKRCG